MMPKVLTANPYLALTVSFLLLHSSFGQEPSRPKTSQNPSKQTQKDSPGVQPSRLRFPIIRDPTPQTQIVEGTTIQISVGLSFLPNAVRSGDNEAPPKPDKVEFLDGSRILGEDTSEPFQLTWEHFEEGCHSLQAMAVYGNFRMSSPPVYVTVLPEKDETDNSSTQSRESVDSRDPRHSTADIGIVVGQTKQFDEQSLALMLQSVESSLAKLRFIDQTTLGSSIGRLQGATQQTSALSVNVAGLPTSAEKLLEKDNKTQSVTDTLNSEGTSTASTVKQDTGSSSERSSEKAAITPATPSIPSQTSAFNLQPNFGLSSQDLLAEQMSLTYQVMNLRMLLDRSLTDRIYKQRKPNDDFGGATFGLRQQAIVGFQISIDTPQKYKNALAEIEISITSKCPFNEPPSLVSLLPRDKTYNVATISKDVKSFGGAAVFQILSVGVASSNSRETLYLVRDTDTVALERLPESRDVKSIKFGWQFRPVLGRKAVEPGTRQVYALLAIPTAPGLDGSPVNTEFTGNVEVRTRWRRYDSKTGAVGDPISPENRQTLNNLTIDESSISDSLLDPQVYEVDWEDAGSGQILVTVSGRNFLPGTSVLLGDTVLDRPEKGLAIQGERNLVFLTSVDKVALIKDALVVGRYGGPVRLRTTAFANRSPNPSSDPLAIEKVELEPVDLQNSKVTITLKSMGGTEDRYVDGSREERHFRPVVTVGSKVFGLSNAPIIISAEPDTFSFVAPTELLRQAKALVVKDLFRGPDYEATAAILMDQDDFAATAVSVLSSDSEVVNVAVIGRNFDKEKKIEVHIGNSTFSNKLATSDPRFITVRGKSLLTLKAQQSEFKGVKMLVISQGSAQPTIIPVPASPSIPGPRVEKVESVYKGDSKTIKVEGLNFDSIAEIKFEKTPLVFKAAPDGRSMTLNIVDEVTREAGDRELKLILKNGSDVPYLLKVAAKKPEAN
jgi:hypothetical protein